MKSHLSAALQYAELGYPLFPCVPGTKQPLTTHGYLDATTDLEQIERWWSASPQANIGLATAGLIAIDIDGASNSWPGVERSLEILGTPLAVTPRGGKHLIFRKPDGKTWRCTQSELADYVDTRTDGGYIVLPPSIRPDGAYHWGFGLELDVPREQLSEPPAWLIAGLDDVERNRSSSPAGNTVGGKSNVIPEGQRNGTLAQLAGVMRRVGMSQSEMTVALLQVNADRCTPPLPTREVERIAGSIARYEPDQVATAVAENHWEQLHTESLPDDASVQADPGPIPEHLLRVPGFISQVMDYTLQTAPYPEVTLAFGGALTLQALLAARKVRDPADNRTNLYLLALANSGAGKDHPRKVNQKILMEVGLLDALGDSFASGEGIEDHVFRTPAVLFQTDEIDGLMTKINQGKEARHEGIMNILLKMFTSANAYYPMRVKAGIQHTVIDQPCLCIFGTAIPKHYYESLSLKMLTNGFFARMLVLETGKRGQGQEARVRPVPADIIATAKWWTEFRPGESRGNLADWHPVPAVVEHSAEAARILKDFRERADHEYGRAEDRNDPVGMAIWARANEKARRLALVYACSENPLQLEISGEAARWASEFVDHQTRRMLFMAGECVSENEFDSRCKKLISTLRAWREKQGDAWMPFWKINRKHPWSDRDHDEIRTTLLNQRLIEFTARQTGGAPQRLYRLA